MEFWLAVAGSLSAFMAHATAGQCKVVNRAPDAQTCFFEGARRPWENGA